MDVGRRPHRELFVTQQHDGCLRKALTPVAVQINGKAEGSPKALEVLLVLHRQASIAFGIGAPKALPDRDTVKEDMPNQ